MKKLLFMSLLFTGFISCDDKDEICYKRAWVTSPSTFPNEYVIENYPYNCDTGQPLHDEAKKTAIFRSYVGQIKKSFKSVC